MYTKVFPALSIETVKSDVDPAIFSEPSAAVGQLSFAEVSGGTSWQAVKTSTFTAVAGEGYFVNTTSNVITMNLPCLLYTSPSPRDLSTSRMPSSA